MSESALHHTFRAFPAFVTGMPKFLPALALIALIGCGGESERPFDELVHSDGQILDPSTMQPYSGLAVATFDQPASAELQRMGVAAGSYHGPFGGLFQEQRVSAKEYYVDGVKHGPYEWYFESGHIFEEGTYAHGRLDGPYKAYWDSGDLYEEGTYRGGNFHGARSWFQDGQLLERVTYRNGVIEGLYERYDAEGTLLVRGTLHVGQPCGTWLEEGRTISHPDCEVQLTQ